jgi:hypothetical protein
MWFNPGKVFVKFVNYRLARALFSSFCVAASWIVLQGFARCCALTVPAELTEVNASEARVRPFSRRW